jgi:DNA repair protein SbcC/Rad50
VRPLLLELEGFGAFRDRTEVDFEGTDQFALVGPTGAGKSTIIDAICFALYGNVPRYDDHRLVGAAMSMGAAEMRVRLRFEVGGERYVAVRIVRRTATGKASTKEARLERELVESTDRGTAATTVVLAGRESEMRDAIDTLLGLSFDDFTRCVVLPQGDFARFLHDKPADRQALLVRLLDLGVYQRLQTRASSQATELDNQIRFIDGQLAELGTSLIDAANLTAEVARLDAARAVVAAAADEVAVVQRAEQDAAAELSRLRVVFAGLRAISVPDGLAERAEAIVAIRAALTSAERELDTAASDVTAREQTIGEVGEPQRWEEVVHRWDRRANGVSVVEQRTATAQADTQAAVDAAAAAEVAAERVVAAQQAVAEVERAHLAHVLAVELQPGEPCPVCEQVVARLPLPMTPAGLNEAKDQLATAGRAADAARRASADAQAAAAKSVSALDHAAALLGEVVEQLADGPDRDTAASNLARSQAAVAELAAARQSEKISRAAAQHARARLADAERAADAGVASFHAQRDAVASLDPPAPGADLAVAWVALERWAQVRSPEVASAIEQAETLARSAKAQIAARVAELTVAAFGEERSPARDIAELQSMIGVAIDRAERAVAAEEQRRQRSASLEAERVGVGERRMVAAEVARLLKADRFQRWLISATIAELAQRASDRLRTMSAGQFSLDVSENGEFAIIDHRAADERRPVRTLSGGETFQASLALALALAEGLAEMSGTARRAMDAIFLDEGFGTLDAESLDVVASTIEELAGADGGRMVGLVTHVPALAERMPVRFRVRRDGRSASVTREVAT